MIAKLVVEHKISRILQIPVYQSMPADYRDLAEVRHAALTFS
jgi:hypothetical protein